MPQTWWISSILILTFMLTSVTADPYNACNQSAEVVFVLDASSSVGEINFQKVRTFTMDVTRRLKAEYQYLNVTVITFSNEAQVTLQLDESIDVNVMLMSVANIKYTHGGTETHKAINLMYKQFHHGINSSKIAIVVTDGASFEPQLTRNASQYAKDHGVSIFVIGIGDDVNQHETKDISSDPDARFLYQLKTFSDLQSITGVFHTQKCTTTTTSTTTTTTVPTTTTSQTTTVTQPITVQPEPSSTPSGIGSATLTTRQPNIHTGQSPSAKPNAQSNKPPTTKPPFILPSTDEYISKTPSHVDGKSPTAKPPYTVTIVPPSVKPPQVSIQTEKPPLQTITSTTEKEPTKPTTTMSTTKYNTKTTVPTTPSTIKSTTTTTAPTTPSTSKATTTTTAPTTPSTTKATTTTTASTTPSTTKATSTTTASTTPSTAVPTTPSTTKATTTTTTTAPTTPSTTKATTTTTTTAPTTPSTTKATTITTTAPTTPSTTKATTTTTTAPTTPSTTKATTTTIPTTPSTTKATTTTTTAPTTSSTTKTTTTTSAPTTPTTEIQTTSSTAVPTTPSTIKATTATTMPTTPSTEKATTTTTIPTTPSTTKASTTTVPTTPSTTKATLTATIPTTPSTTKATTTTSEPTTKLTTESTTTTIESTTDFTTEATPATTEPTTISTKTSLKQTKLSSTTLTTPTRPTTAPTTTETSTTAAQPTTSQPTSPATIKPVTQTATSQKQPTTTSSPVSQLPITEATTSSPTTNSTTRPSTTTTDNPITTSTLPPTTTTASCIAKIADVVFVVDTSGSIGLANFEKVKSFIKEVIMTFDVSPQYTWVGLIEYSTYAHMEFKLNEKSNLTDLLEAVENVTYSGGGTATSDALQLMRIEGFEKERPAAPDIAIVITDGLSKFPSLTRAQANLAKKEGITMFSIGIGNETATSELIAIATNKHYVFEVGDYETLLTLDNVVAHRACGVDLPAEYHVRSTKPPSTTPFGCVDLDANCDSYPRDSCTDYAPYAKKKCARKCGYCPGYPIVEPPCEDTRADCASYGTAICLSSSQYEWADKNCRKHCSFCGNKTEITTTPVPTTPAMTTAATCFDVEPKCSKYGGPSMCTSPTYISWAKHNCAKYCGYCYVYHTVTSATVNKVKCPKWTLPGQCTLDYSTGSCCPFPKCPDGFKLNVRRKLK